jgi:hypothetical protein
MTPDESFREMPLEVRVSSDAIAEIYGVRDFFGNYATATAGGARRDEEIWEAMRVGVIRERGSRVSAFLTRWRRGAVLAAGAGLLVLILVVWWSR